METATRLVITVLFIGLIAVAIVFFGVFGIIPAKKTTTVLNIEEKTIVREVEGTTTQAVVPGTSPVTEEGNVVSSENTPVRLDVQPGTPEAPQQSNPIDPSKLSEEAVKITVAETGFSPDIFEVNEGTAVTISVSAVDDYTHVFKFKDPALSAVAVGIAPHETRAITFNAPAKGVYEFFCDVPGHAGRGETGTMTVK